MTEIRTIKESEGEAFLQLLCNVFKLDFDRAYSIFFSEPLFDLDRKWALFEGPEMISILTTSPLEFGWGRAVGIAGVSTRVDRQQEGHAGRLVQRVLRESERRDEGPAMLFAADARLYETLGFEKLDRVIRARVAVDPEIMRGQTMSNLQAKSIYNDWSLGDAHRLRRDSKRWEYWEFHMRTCQAFDTGYMCLEKNLLREAVFSKPVPALPLSGDTEWFGTTFMTDQLGLEVTDIMVETYLMGYEVPGIPQLFMTDQF